MVDYDKALLARVNVLRQRFLYRDRKAREVLAIRRGEWDSLDPEAFSDAFPGPIVANMLEVQARHATAALSPMPGIACREPSAGASQAAKDRADKRTAIVNH